MPSHKPAEFSELDRRADAEAWPLAILAILAAIIIGLIFNF